MNKTERSQKLVFQCVVIMLRPILKFCMRYSIKLPDLVECCKIVLVQLAKEQLEESDVPISMSHISIISGVTRREVKRIYLEKTEKVEPLSLSTKIIGQWRYDASFCTQAGKPRVLDAEGADSEFARLVRSVSGDMNPYTVLFELDRAGVIERTASGKVRLCGPAYGPVDDLKESAKLIATDVSDLMAAIEENMAEEVPQLRNYHLVAEYDNIAKDAVPELKRWLLQHGTRFHKKVAKHLSQFDKDVNPDLADKEAGVRVVFGGFSRVAYSSQS